MRRLFPRARSETPTRNVHDKNSTEFDPETKMEEDSVSRPSPVRKGFKAAPSTRPTRPGSEPPGLRKNSRSSSAPIKRKPEQPNTPVGGKSNPRGKSPSSPSWIVKQAGRVMRTASSSPSPDRSSQRPKPPPSSSSSSSSSGGGVIRFNRFQRNSKTSQDRTSPSSSLSKSELGSKGREPDPSSDSKSRSGSRKSTARRLVGMMTGSPRAQGGMNPRPRPKGFASKSRDKKPTPTTPSSSASSSASSLDNSNAGVTHQTPTKKAIESSSSKPAPVRKGGTGSAPRSNSTTKPSRKVPPPVRGKSVTKSNSRGKSTSTIPTPSPSNTGGVSYKKRSTSTNDSIDRSPSGQEDAPPPPPPPLPPPLPPSSNQVGEIGADGNKIEQKITSRAITYSASSAGSEMMSPNSAHHSSDSKERPMSPRILAQMPLPTADGSYTSPTGSGLTFDGTFKGWSYASRPDIRLGELVAVDFLGKGHFGEVKCVAWRPNKGPETKGLYALKILERDRFENKMVASGRSEEYYIFNEREIMIEVNSSFHIKLINTYKSSKNLYILMEYAPGRNLKDQIERGKGLTDSSQQGALNRVKFYAANLVLAMQHLHRRQITHRDLKPGNILIDNQGYLKVCDYGFSRWLPIGGKTRSIAGTYNYLTPEQCLDDDYDHNVDIWCLGITVYNMSYGVTPFEAPEGAADWQKITMNNIQNKPLSFIESTRDLPMPGKLFVKSILSREPKRFGYDLNYEAIKTHVWFNGVDFDALENRSLKSPWIPDLDDPNKF